MMFLAPLIQALPSLASRYLAPLLMRLLTDAALQHAAVTAAERMARRSSNQVDDRAVGVVKEALQIYREVTGK